MANPLWPSSLPGPLIDNVQYAPLAPNVASTPMETGAPKYRRRFTDVPETLTVTLMLTADQYATLNTFVVTTLQDVGLFDWTDFRSGATATYQFTQRPTYAPASAGANRLWRATLNLLKQS